MSKWIEYLVVVFLVVVGFVLRRFGPKDLLFGRDKKFSERSRR